jgi:hypothetical protein
MACWRRRDRHLWVTSLTACAAKPLGNAPEVIVPEKKVKVPLNNQMMDAIDVAIEESIERWTDLKLADGAQLRVKMSVISAARIEGMFDPSGNPTYFLNMTPTMAVVAVPDKLKQRRK